MFLKGWITSLLVATSSSVFSQISIWPKVGGNLAWTTYPSQANVSASSASNFGFYGGVAVDISIAKDFSLRPELIYNQWNVSWSSEYYTANSNGSTSRVTTSRNERRQYISLPINLVRHIALGKNDFQIILGGYISQALGGGSYDQQYSEATNNGTALYAEGHGNMIAGSVPKSTGVVAPPGTIVIGAPIPLPYYNPTDVGVNAGVGYQMNRFLITAQLGLGLTNTQPHYDDTDQEAARKDSKTSNRSLSLGIAYRYSRIYTQ